jgi:DNA-binding phage protein
MTLPALIAALRRRIARSHTSGGLTVVAAQLGVSKQTLHDLVMEKKTPTAETQAALVAALQRKG